MIRKHYNSILWNWKEEARDSSPNFFPDSGLNLSKRRIYMPILVYFDGDFAAIARRTIDIASGFDYNVSCISLCIQYQFLRKVVNVFC